MISKNEAENAANSHASSLDCVRHVALHDALRQRLDHSRFADARLADWKRKEREVD
jgi:hypothetical protein